jgi:TonB family protein
LIGKRSALAWAVCGSAFVHAALVVVPLGGGERGYLPSRPLALDATRPAPRTLEATIASVQPARNGALLPFVGPAPLALPLTMMAAPLPPPYVLPPLEHGAASSRAAAPGEGLVQANLVTDRTHVGRLIARETEFPAEIGTPVRLTTPVVVQYPPRLRAAGREDNVTLWIIVDADGRIEEVQLAQGTPEFAEPAIAAVQAARFVPATNNRQPIRFYIALEFRYVLAAPSPAAGAVTTAQN